MFHIYYLEINITCIILLFLVFFRLDKDRSVNSTTQMYLKYLVTSLQMFCLSDMVAAVCRGATFYGARLLIETSNLFYLEMMPLISMFWYFYVCTRLGVERTKKQKVIDCLPLILYTILAISNPFTNILFSINAENLYVRGPGVFLHWIASWYYLGYAGILSLKAYLSAKNWVEKNESYPLLLFLVFPVIGSVLQMAFYGVTSVQVGITISIVMISMRTQESRISKDELTSLNNRSALRFFIHEILEKNESTHISVMMIDINNFKRINDTLGHLEGDKALIDTANILKKVCDNAKERVFLSRYGGDEFVIIGRNTSIELIEDIANEINETCMKFDEEMGRPYKLDVSIGYSHGIMQSVDEFSHYLNLADEKMYEEKKLKNVLR